MNKKQRIVLAIGAILIIIMMLYPPFDVYKLSGNEVQTLDYSFLFDPPKTIDSWTAKINFKRLINQWLIIIVPTALLYWAFKD